MVANFEIVTGPHCHFFLSGLPLLCLLGYVFSVLVPSYVMHMELETEYHGQVRELLHIQKAPGSNVVPAEILCVCSVL